MHTGALIGAVQYFLQTYWTLDGGGEVKAVPPPGRPTGMQGAWAVTIHDLPQSFEGLNGFYPRYGCMVTFSAKLDGAPVTELQDFLRQPVTGFLATRDALAAFLHRYRWAIREWTDRLTDAMPLGGVLTNMVEAARPLTATPTTARGPEWWDQATGRILTALGNREDARTCGYSSDILFGAGLSMQSDTPTER